MPDIGITGGIGSGKTLVSQIFRNLGIPVYYADERARYLMNQDKALVTKIMDFFGPEAFRNGMLNRKFLAEEVFGDEKKREQLNRLVHPAVQEDFRKWKTAWKDKPYRLKEAALLFEAGTYRDLDRTILILAPESLRISRILLRDPHRTTEDAKKIMATQMKDTEKKTLADYVIVNDENRLVIPQVLKIHRELMKDFTP